MVAKVLFLLLFLSEIKWQKCKFENTFGPLLLSISIFAKAMHGICDDMKDWPQDVRVLEKQHDTVIKGEMILEYIFDWEGIDLFIPGAPFASLLCTCQCPGVWGFDGDPESHRQWFLVLMIWWVMLRQRQFGVQWKHLIWTWGWGVENEGLLISVTSKPKSEGKERQEEWSCRDLVCVISRKHEIVGHILGTRNNLGPVADHVKKWSYLSSRLVETITKAIVFIW